MTARKNPATDSASAGLPDVAPTADTPDTPDAPATADAPDAAAAPDGDTYVVVATHPIDLPDGRTGVPATAVVLTAEQAAPLLADGHIVRPEAVPAENEE